MSCLCHVSLIYFHFCHTMCFALKPEMNFPCEWTIKRSPLFYSVLQFPQGSPIIKNLSVAILQLSEAGELAYLRSKWWASSCIADKAKSLAVQPQSLKGMFLVLSLGLGLGALLAVLELTSKSRRSAAEQRVCASACTNHITSVRQKKKKKNPSPKCQLFRLYTKQPFLLLHIVHLCLFRKILNNVISL